MIRSVRVRSRARAARAALPRFGWRTMAGPGLFGPIRVERLRREPFRRRRRRWRVGLWVRVRRRPGRAALVRFEVLALPIRAVMAERRLRTVMARARLEARAALVARDLESRARVAMVASRPPVPAAPIARRFRAKAEARRFGRLPETAALEPAERHIRLCALKLAE